MFQLTKQDIGPWARMVDNIILDEYLDEAGQPGPGVPVLIRPEHFLSNVSRPKEGPWTSNEYYFPDEKLSVLWTLLDLQCFDEAKAVELYQADWDIDLAEERAGDWLTLPQGLYWFDEEAQAYTLFTTEGRFLNEALTILRDNELTLGEEGHGWGHYTEATGDWAFMGRAFELSNLLGLHLVEFDPESNGGCYILTEWMLSPDVIGTFDDLLHGEDLWKSYAFAHEPGWVNEPPYWIRRRNAYKGGGFSCMS